jgi:hypothetical protein
MKLARGAGADPTQVRRAVLRASLIDHDRVAQQDELKRLIQLAESLHLTTGMSILDAAIAGLFLFFMEPLGG